MRSAINNWDFWTSLPEAFHQVTIVMSDRGIPASYRHMHGFGSHTFSFINADKERYWVKFHFKTQQGIKNLTDQEAAEIIGSDRESHHRDLYQAIENRDFPKWKMYVQIMPELEADKVNFNPFDLTKIWSQTDYPLIPVGEFELNRNQKTSMQKLNNLPLIRQPSFLVLVSHQTRCYKDACLPMAMRSAIVLASITIKSLLMHPNVQFTATTVMGQCESTATTVQQLAMSQTQNKSGPNSLIFQEPPLRIQGDADHYDHRVDEDYFSQAGDLFRLMNNEQRQALFDNTARAMQGVPKGHSRTPH